MLWRGAKIILFGLLGCLAPAVGSAHNLTITQVTATFDQPGSVAITIDLDLGLFVEPEGYYALSRQPAGAQRAAVERLLPEILAGLQLFVGENQLEPALLGWTLPAGTRPEFLDVAVQKVTELRFRATLPAVAAPLQLAVPYDSKLGHPMVFVARIPSAGIATSSVIDESGSVSDAFAWAGLAPGSTAGAATSPAVSRPPWYRELGVYLGLGFRHIVPEGADHILFVLGLFFLGLTWRKLLAQTTVFTLAHATTLFLSTYGIFSLSSRWVEPAIALSIAFIALENLWSQKLGPGRLAVVFGFGLIHGLGFASSLQEVSFPRQDFLIALLGFNFGVDIGQLGVIGVALLTVGWFRDKPWFRQRIVIPGSLVIAGTGLFWAAQRIWFYWVR